MSRSNNQLKCIQIPRHSIWDLDLRLEGGQQDGRSYHYCYVLHVYHTRTWAQLQSNY